MKKLINAIVMLLLIASTLLYTTTLFVEGSMSQVSSSLIETEIETRVYAIVDEIQQIIPVQNDEAVEKLMTGIKEDPVVNETLEKYAKTFIHDLATEEGDVNMDMNQEVQDLLLTYSDELGDVMGDIINEDYKNAIIKEVVSRVDFNDYYIKAVEKVKETVSPNQMKAVQLANTVVEQTPQFKTGSLIASIVFMIILVVLNITSGFGLKQIGVALILSGLIHVVLKFAAPILLSLFVPQMNDLLGFEIFTKIGFMILGVGVVVRVIGSFIPGAHEYE